MQLQLPSKALYPRNLTYQHKAMPHEASPLFCLNGIQEASIHNQPQIKTTKDNLTLSQYIILLHH